ncbi:hypothetical protein GIB67_012695 [Kingdonia uniflora]|uniref:Uncharacterized protein n=1 Tax=Kingdonia uniflora TaxID=39325 RepID=A0A7J7NG04_9MAGN|nr:hypothetical protein GIB67_012695 [Kingdonia uniflora]
MHLLNLQFYIYERLKQLLSSSAQSNSHPSTIQTLFCGGLVGSIAALFTTPFDVVKTRLQTETSLKWIMAMQMHDIACCSFYHEQVSILEQMNMSSSLAIWNASYWGLYLYSRVITFAPTATLASIISTRVVHYDVFPIATSTSIVSTGVAYFGVFPAATSSSMAFAGVVYSDVFRPCSSRGLLIPLFSRGFLQKKLQRFHQKFYQRLNRQFPNISIRTESTIPVSEQAHKILEYTTPAYAILAKVTAGKTP